MIPPMIGYLLTDILRLVRKEFRDDPRLSCTMAQARALKQISHNEGIKQVKLAELLEIKPMTLVRTIDSLVEEGLVERRADLSDRRAHLIYTMSAAEERIKAIHNVNHDIWKQALDGLTNEEIEQLNASLEHIHQNLSKFSES